MADLKILLTEQQIAKRVAELADIISQRYRFDTPLCIGVLKGCYPFFADLTRKMSCPLTVDFIGVSSYGTHTETTGELRLMHDLSSSARARHVVLVEDIVDTGLTIQFLRGLLLPRQPLSIAVATLLHKPQCMRVRTQPDFVGFTIGPEFVYGYGLDDTDGTGRNLPYIVVKNAP